MAILGGRRVVANISLTLDGKYNGPGGPNDLSMIVPYARTEVARNHLARIWEGATTAVLGRINAEGFLSYWPIVAEDENADSRDRAYARWLVDTEKVVLSKTLTKAAWKQTRVIDASASDAIKDLKGTGDGNILVNSSASIIKSLLKADLLDRLYLMICPEIAGGGEQLFDSALPSSKWALTSLEAGEMGEIAMVYDRIP